MGRSYGPTLINSMPSMCLGMRMELIGVAVNRIDLIAFNINNTNNLNRFIERSRSK